LSTELKVTESPIPGLYVVQLPVHGDSRGWFKENWQNEKLLALGLPNFKPVQNNISYNEKKGTTRGIHAEPWDKYVSVANGKVFGAWVDLREGSTFGKVFTTEITPGTAVFVPRGVGNAYQTLEPNTSYTYLVNDHWSPKAKYTFLNLADETVNIYWPIKLEDAEISNKDLGHPQLKDVTPIQPKKVVILGANGQLGKALQIEFPKSIALTRAQFDLADTNTWDSIDWGDVETIINAAAYTKVDEAETPEGRRLAWATNATGVGNLAKRCEQNEITLVHISSDYVFDGTKESPYTEEDPLSPLGVYGQSKAAGDLLATSISKHYVLRTSWVIGDGPNFIVTMKRLAKAGATPKVVNDQFGRITYVKDLARIISTLLVQSAPFGIYNFSSSSDVLNWHQIADHIFKYYNEAQGAVNPVSTAEYIQIKSGNIPIALRPPYSVFNLSKTSSYFKDSTDWKERINDYLKNEN
jgi:dTDP-4-dehydrorhamnose reductase/dTDP-4-dehydrorhamnose 3,5-epimerase